ncbi:MAG: NlpC/P60 family protein [Bacteroidota bacterium]
MKINKYILIIMLALSLAACRQDDKIEQIVHHFREDLSGDRRENVFQVEAIKSGKSYTLKGEMDNPALKQLLFDSLREEGFSIIDSITLLPAAVEYPWGIVTISTANLRSEPRHRAELVNQALMGTPVKILKEARSWVMIQTPDHYLAWCEKSALHRISEEEMIQWQNSPRLIVKTPYYQMLQSSTHLPVTDLVKGCILEKVDEVGKDILVKLPDGRQGIIPGNIVMDFDLWRQNTFLQQDQLLKEAFDMTGIPYLWGGTSNKGIDCSGFTRMTYFFNGVILARDASLQVRHGEPVEITPNAESFEPGDLLFFSASAENEHPITHVGMYIGNHKFIHASGRVKVNSLNPQDEDYDEYNTRRLKFVQRITGQENTPGIVAVKDHPWY